VKFRFMDLFAYLQCSFSRMRNACVAVLQGFRKNMTGASYALTLAAFYRTRAPQVRTVLRDVQRVRQMQIRVTLPKLGTEVRSRTGRLGTP
jgi:uncharacterized protein HemX